MKRKRKRKIPVISEEELAEIYQNQKRDDPDVVRYSRIGYFLKNAILWYLGLNIGWFIFAENPELYMSKGLFQFGMLVWAGLMGYIFQVQKFG